MTANEEVNLLLEELYASLRLHWRSVLGAVIGLIIALLFMIIGFWRTLLLVICVGMGWWVGRQLEDKERFARLLDRFLPGGSSGYKEG